MLIVPVYNMIILPNASLHLPVDQIRKNTGANGITINEKVVLIVAKATSSDMEADNFYPIGVSGVIKAINPKGFAVIQMQHRVNIESIIVNEDHTIKLTLSQRSECEDLDKETEQAKVDALVQEIRRFASGFQWKDTAEFFINQINTIEMAACVMAPALEISNEQRYEILAQDSRAQRAEIIEKTIY